MAGSKFSTQKENDRAGAREYRLAKQPSLCSMPASNPSTIDCPPCLLARAGRKRDFRVSRIALAHPARE